MPGRRGGRLVVKVRGGTLTACAGVRVRCGVGSADNRGEEMDESRVGLPRRAVRSAHMLAAVHLDIRLDGVVGTEHGEPEVAPAACSGVQARSGGLHPRISLASMAGSPLRWRCRAPAGGKADALAGGPPGPARAPLAPISPTGSAASVGAVRKLADWSGEHRAGG
jgi:hypothetical protein